VASGALEKLDRSLWLALLLSVRGHLFCTGIGFKLMFIESECLIDVLLALIDRSIVALPVHDAVIVPVSAVESAKAINLLQRITKADELGQELLQPPPGVVEETLRLH
jgi:hypothetical protein